MASLGVDAHTFSLCEFEIDAGLARKDRCLPQAARQRPSVVGLGL
jgi:hypothetical protein